MIYLICALMVAVNIIYSRASQLGYKKYLAYCFVYRARTVSTFLFRLLFRLPHF